MNAAALSPDATLTRAQFTAMTVRALYTQRQIDSCFGIIVSSKNPSFRLLYRDVSVRSQYAKELCIAMRDGIAKGYRDGTFHPNRSITFDEASKVLARAYGLSPYAEAEQSNPWFRQYVTILGQRHAIPLTVTSFDHRMNVQESLDMIKRVHDGVTWKPSRTYAELEDLTKPPVLHTVESPVGGGGRTPIKGSTSSERQSESSSSSVPWYKFF